jgi:hypothetical protein
MPPLSFLEDSLNKVKGGDYNGYFSEDEETFGVHQEAFCRKSYRHIADLIHAEYYKDTVTNYLAIVSGSSGVGKSVFLAYMIAKLRFTGYTNFALFHAPKGTRLPDGSIHQGQISCSVWIDDEKVVDGNFHQVEYLLKSKLCDVEVVIMDGWTAGTAGRLEVLPIPGPDYLVCLPKPIHCGHKERVYGQLRPVLHASP